MSSRIEFSTLCTPIASIPALTGGIDNEAVETIANSVQRSLGGGGNVVVTFGVVAGFTTGSVIYKNAGAGITYPLNGLGTFKFIHIKHTGFQYSSSSVLGAVSTDTLKLWINYNNAAQINFVSLLPGQSVILPIGADMTFTTLGIDLGIQATANTIAVELMATT